jgi:predicted signal transduction protein with EAL and GGDEF domain
MNTLVYLATQWVQLAYWYCVDFMVNLANLTHTSYPEANSWVLLLLLPALLGALVVVRVAQWWQLRRLRQKSAKVSVSTKRV